MKPKSLQDLISKLNAIPGITKKQSEKIAYNMIDKNKEEAEEVAIAIRAALESIKKCKNCGHLTDEELCDICISRDRKKILVIVESSMDVFKFEDTQEKFKPYYHVLGGLINVSKRIEIEDLNIENLQERAKDYSEVIIALSPNIEGIVTSNYIKELLINKKVTQLAQGIPLGAAMEYVDELTLKAALDNRKDIK